MQNESVAAPFARTIFRCYVINGATGACSARKIPESPSGSKSAADGRTVI